MTYLVIIYSASLNTVHPQLPSLFSRSNNVNYYWLLSWASIILFIFCWNGFQLGLVRIRIKLILYCCKWDIEELHAHKASRRASYIYCTEIRKLHILPKREFQWSSSALGYLVRFNLKAAIKSLFNR